MSVLLAVAALPCGLLIGLLLGALGGGGSVLAVPALVGLLGQSPHEATAGALVVVAVGAVSGLVCHARAGRVRWAAGAVFGALGTAGSYVGSRWSAALRPDVLMTAFAGLMLVVAAMLVWREVRAGRAAEPTPSRPVGETARPARDPSRPVGETARPVRDPNRPLRDPAQPLRDPARPAAPATPATPPAPLSDPAPLSETASDTASASAPDAVSLPHTGSPSRTVLLSRPVRVAVTASAVGLLTGFFGVGGGFVVVPALTLVLGLEMPVAIGTSLLVILINSLTALGTRAGTGGLDWRLLAGFAACAAIGSQLGNRLTTRLRPRTLTTAFAALVTVLALAMATTAVPHL
ncbi:sulfite exporter TauE/SafE family protein [Streptomyces lydicus]|uniref:sulfite exporter TauE/SafE family protein n=1 Tax=Streptomyces lydicus TaxID=47763 RepID=UPI0037A89C44